jgi:hypothetical protein
MLRRAFLTAMAFVILLAGLAFLAQYQNYKRAKADYERLKRAETAAPHDQTSR